MTVPHTDEIDLSRLKLFPAVTIARADQLAARLIDEIAAGRFAPDSQLPPEAQLAATAGVSRLTAREAIKSLVAKHVVRIERGRGTFVNPVSSWSPLDPQLLIARFATGSAGTRAKYVLNLCEMRRCIETGAAELCAIRRSEDDLIELRGHLDDMRRYHVADLSTASLGHSDTNAHADAVAGFAAADLSFHQTILTATRNDFITTLLQPIEVAIVLVREMTSFDPNSRVQAIGDHEDVLAAIDSGADIAAGSAMRTHLDHTIQNVAKLVPPPPQVSLST